MAPIPEGLQGLQASGTLSLGPWGPWVDNWWGLRPPLPQTPPPDKSAASAASSSVATLGP